MKIKSCRPYQARIVSHRKLTMADGKSVFKLYFVSIVGRDKPELYEWQQCPISEDEFERQFRQTHEEGIGFLTVFPHITKVFVYAPSSEILMFVKAFETETFKPIDLSREEGYTEFACYAEAILAANEYAAWAEADTVQDYLQYWCPTEDAPIVNNTKLHAYWCG